MPTKELLLCDVNPRTTPEKGMIGMGFQENHGAVEGQKIVSDGRGIPYIEIDAGEEWIDQGEIGKKMDVGLIGIGCHEGFDQVGRLPQAIGVDFDEEVGLLR